MKKYHKIKTLFERETTGTKKLIPGRYAHELFEYLKDNIWIYTEKVDGTNIRICWDGNRISFLGKTESSQLPKNLLDKLNNMFSNEETEQLFEQIFGDKEAIIFGEGYGSKIQKNGHLYSEHAEFIVFDISIDGTYLERLNVEDICTSLNLECVPVVLIGTLQDGVDYVTTKETPKSVVGKENLSMEGIVGVPAKRIYDVCGERVIVKIKVRDFKECGR